jgi:PAS domain S-box-containing protein
MNDPDRSHESLAEEVQRLRARLAEHEPEREEAHLYRLLFERNPDSTWVFDSTTFAFLAVNEATVRHYGFSRADLLAATIERILPDDEWQRFRQSWQSARPRDGADPEICPFGEWKQRRADGSVFDTEVLASHLIFRGRPACLMLVRDITERRAAEAALRESEERHRLISALTSDYTYACRVEPDGRIVIESSTEGMHTITGYSAAEAEAFGGWPSLIHADDLAEAQRMAERSLAGEQTWVELRLRTRAGDARWVRVFTRPLRDEALGRVVRLLGAVQDVTERKKNERQLADYNRRLQELSRRLLEVQEEERSRLALELHEQIGQNLAGLQFGLETWARLLPDELRSGLAEAQGQLRELTGRVRDLSLELRPTMLDDLGLLPALLWQIERSTAHLRIPIDFQHRGLERRRFPPAVETAAYRIVQEALAGIDRHGDPDWIAVKVWGEGGLLRVQVENPWSGFDTASGWATSLAAMQERAALLGGRLSVEPLSGQGARLDAELPVAGTVVSPS